MPKLKRFFPRFNHILCRKPPKTSFAQFEEKVRKLRQSTLSELATIFSDYIAVDMFEWKETGGEFLSSRLQLWRHILGFFTSSPHA